MIQVRFEKEEYYPVMVESKYGGGRYFDLDEKTYKAWKRAKAAFLKYDAIILRKYEEAER